MKRGDGEALLLSIVLILALVAVVFTVANTDFSLVSATGAQTVATSGTLQDYCRPETTEGWTPGSEGPPTVAQPNCACADKKISDCGNTPSGYSLPQNIPKDGSQEIWMRACAPHSLGCEDSYYTKSCLKGVPLECVCASQKISDCGNTPSGYTLPKNIPKDGSVSIWADICNPKPPCEDSYTTRPCDNCGCPACPPSSDAYPFSTGIHTEYDVPIKPPVDPNPPAGGGGGGDPSCGDSGNDVDDVMGMHLVFSEIGTTSARTQAILAPEASREPTALEHALTTVNDFFARPYQPTRAFWEQKVVADAEQAAQELQNAAHTDAQRTLTNDIAFATISRSDALAANPTILDAIQNTITSIFTSTTGALIADPLGKTKPAKTAFGKVLPVLTPTPSDENVVDDLYNERVADANNKASLAIGAAASCGKASIAAAKANAQQLANLEDVPTPDIPARTVDWDALDPQKEWRGEFIEIHNPSQKAMSLRNYYITDGTYVSDQDKAIFQAQANAYEAWRAQKDKTELRAAEASFDSRAPTNAVTTLAASLTTTRTPNGVFATVTGGSLATPIIKMPTPIITQNQQGLPNIDPAQLTGNYYWLITTDPSRSGGGTWGDFHAKFNPDAVIGPGETQIIALSATGFKEVYGFLPTYEIINTDPAVMDVIPAYPGAIDYDLIGPLLSDVTTEGALTGETIKNPAGAGEMLAMYYWNGKSNLVQDIDYVVWGDERKSGVDKTGITINGEQYLWDAPVQFDDAAIQAPIHLDSTRTFAETNTFTTTARAAHTARAPTPTAFGPAALTLEATPNVAISARITETNALTAEQARLATTSATDTARGILADTTLASALTQDRLPINLLAPPTPESPLEQEQSCTPAANTLASTVPERDLDAAAEHVAQGGIYQIPIPVPAQTGQPSVDIEAHPYLPGIFQISKDQSFGIASIFGATPEQALENACPSASALSITAASRTLASKNIVIDTPNTPSISFPDLNSRPTAVLMPGGTPLIPYADFAGGRALHDSTELTNIRATTGIQERLSPLLSTSATARRNAQLAALNENANTVTFTSGTSTPQTLAANTERDQGIITYQRDPCQPANEPDEEKSTVKTKGLTPQPTDINRNMNANGEGQLTGEATATNAPAGIFKLAQTPHYDATCEHNGIPITKEGGVVECHDEQSENLAVAFQRQPATPGTLGVCDVSAGRNTDILGPNAPAGGLLDSEGGSHGGSARAGSYNGITLTNANLIQQNFLSSTGVFNGILNAFASFAQGKGSDKDKLWKDFMKAQGNDLAQQYNELYDMMLTASDIAAMSDFAIQHSIDPDGSHITRAAERLVRDPQEHWNDAEDSYDHAANWLDYTKNSLDRAKASGDQDDIARAQQKYDAALADANAKRQAADSARALYEKLANPSARVDSAQQAYNNADAAAKAALQKYSQLPDGSPEQQAAYAEYLQLKAQKEAAQKELDAAKTQLANDPTGALAKQEYLEQQAAYAALVKSYGLDIGGAITSSQLADFFEQQALLAGFGGPIDGLSREDFEALAAQARGQGFNAALHSYLGNKLDQFTSHVNDAISAAQDNIDRLQKALDDAKGTDKEKDAQDKLDKAKEELKQAQDYAATAADLLAAFKALDPNDPDYEAKLEELLHALMKALAHAQAAAGLHGTVDVYWDNVPVFVIAQAPQDCTGTGEGCPKQVACTIKILDHYDITLEGVVDDSDGDGIPDKDDPDPDGDGKFDTNGDGQEDSVDTDGDGKPDTPMNAADQANNKEGNPNQDPGGPGGAAAAAARSGGSEAEPEPPTVPPLPFPIDVPAARSEQREWEAVRAMTEALPEETGATSTETSAAATDKALDAAKNAQADARDAKIKELKDLLARIKELKKEEIEKLKKLLKDLGIEYKDGKILLPDGTILDDQGRLLESRFPEGKNIANAQQALNAKLAAHNAAQQTAHQAFIDGLATHGITVQGDQWFFAGKPIQNPLETGGQLIGLDGTLYGTPTFDLPAGQANLAGYINNYYAPAQFADANGKPVDANNVIWHDGKYIDSSTGKEVTVTDPGGELTRIGLAQTRDFSDGMQQLYGSFHDANGNLVNPLDVRNVVIATDGDTGLPIYGLVGPDGTAVTADNKGLYADLGIDFSGFDDNGQPILTHNGNPAFVDSNGNVVVQTPVYDAYGNVVGTKLTNLDGHDVVYGKDGTLYHDVGKQINLHGSEQEIADQLKAYGIGYEFSGFYKDGVHVDVQFVKGKTSALDSVNIIDGTGKILLTTTDAGIVGVFHNLEGYSLQEAQTTVQLYQAITGVNNLRVDQLDNLGLTSAEQAELAAAITTATMHDVQGLMNDGNYAGALKAYNDAGLPTDTDTYKTLSIITQAQEALRNAGDSIESREAALSTIGNLQAAAGLAGLDNVADYLDAMSKGLYENVALQVKAKEAITAAQARVSELTGTIEAITDEIQQLKDEKIQRDINHEAYDDIDAKIAALEQQKLQAQTQLAINNLLVSTIGKTPSETTLILTQAAQKVIDDHDAANELTAQNENGAADIFEGDVSQSEQQRRDAAQNNFASSLRAIATLAAANKDTVTLDYLAATLQSSIKYNLALSSDQKASMTTDDNYEAWIESEIKASGSLLIELAYQQARAEGKDPNTAILDARSAYLDVIQTQRGNNEELGSHDAAVLFSQSDILYDLLAGYGSAYDAKRDQAGINALADGVVSGLQLAKQLYVQDALQTAQGLTGDAYTSFMTDVTSQSIQIDMDLARHASEQMVDYLELQGIQFQAEANWKDFLVSTGANEFFGLDIQTPEQGIQQFSDILQARADSYDALLRLEDVNFDFSQLSPGDQRTIGSTYQLLTMGQPIDSSFLYDQDGAFSVGWFGQTIGGFATVEGVLSFAISGPLASLGLSATGNVLGRIIGEEALGALTAPIKSVAGFFFDTISQEVSKSVGKSVFADILRLTQPLGTKASNAVAGFFGGTVKTLTGEYLIEEVLYSGIAGDMLGKVSPGLSNLGDILELAEGHGGLINFRVSGAKLGATSQSYLITPEGSGVMYTFKDSITAATAAFTSAEQLGYEFDASATQPDGSLVFKNRDSVFVFAIDNSATAELYQQTAITEPSVLVTPTGIVMFQQLGEGVLAADAESAAARIPGYQNGFVDANGNFVATYVATKNGKTAETTMIFGHEQPVGSKIITAQDTLTAHYSTKGRNDLQTALQNTLPVDVRKTSVLTTQQGLLQEYSINKDPQEINDALYAEGYSVGTTGKYVVAIKDGERYIINTGSPTTIGTTIGPITVFDVKPALVTSTTHYLTENGQAITQHGTNDLAHWRSLAVEANANAIETATTPEEVTALQITQAAVVTDHFGRPLNAIVITTRTDAGISIDIYTNPSADIAFFEGFGLTEQGVTQTNDFTVENAHVDAPETIPDITASIAFEDGANEYLRQNAQTGEVICEDCCKMGGSYPCKPILNKVAANNKKPALDAGTERVSAQAEQALQNVPVLPVPPSIGFFGKLFSGRAQEAYTLFVQKFESSDPYSAIPQALVITRTYPGTAQARAAQAWLDSVRTAYEALRGPGMFYGGTFATYASIATKWEDPRYFMNILAHSQPAFISATDLQNILAIASPRVASIVKLSQFLQQTRGVPAYSVDTLDTKDPRIFAAAKNYDINAHGTRSLGSILGIIIHGRIESKYNGLLKEGDPAYAAGEHGPFYVLTSTRENWQDAANHNAYLVIDEQARTYLTTEINRAVTEGLMTRANADAAIAKIQTYDEFVTAANDGTLPYPKANALTVQTPISAAQKNPVVGEQARETVDDHLQKAVENIKCHSPCAIAPGLLNKLSSLEKEGKLTTQAKAALTAIAENPDFVNELKTQLHKEQKYAYIDNELVKYGLTGEIPRDVLDFVFSEPSLTLLPEQLTMPAIVNNEELPQETRDALRDKVTEANKQFALTNQYLADVKFKEARDAFLKGLRTISTLNTALEDELLQDISPSLETALLAAIKDLEKQKARINNEDDFGSNSIMLKRLTQLSLKGDYAPNLIDLDLEEKLQKAPQVLRLKKIIGSGGFGYTFLADVRFTDGTTKEKVVKFMHPGAFATIIIETNPTSQAADKTRILIRETIAEGFVNDVTDIQDRFKSMQQLPAKYDLLHQMDLPAPQGYGLVRVPGTNAYDGSNPAYMVDLVAGKTSDKITPLEAKRLLDAGMEKHLDEIVLRLAQGVPSGPNKGLPQLFPDIRNNAMLNPDAATLEDMVTFIDPGVMVADEAWRADYERFAVAGEFAKADALAVDHMLFGVTETAKNRAIEDAKDRSTYRNPSYGMLTLKNQLRKKAGLATLWDGEGEQPVTSIIAETAVNPDGPNDPMIDQDPIFLSILGNAPAEAAP